MGKVHGSYLVWALLTLIPQKFWKKSLRMPVFFFLTHPHKANISSHASPVSIGASSQYSAITKMAQQSKSSAVKLAHTVWNFTQKDHKKLKTTHVWHPHPLCCSLFHMDKMMSNTYFPLMLIVCSSEMLIPINSSRELQLQMWSRNICKSSLWVNWESQDKCGQWRWMGCACLELNWTPNCVCRAAPRPECGLCLCNWRVFFA